MGDEKITLSDLRARAGDDLDQMDSRYHQERHKLIDKTLQDMVRERVLSAEAKKRGKTVDELVAAEAGGAIEPSEVEMTAWYASNQARLGGRSFEQLRSQISDFLRKEKYRQAASKLDARLDKENQVAIYLEPYRVNFNNDGAPSMGPANSPVTLVEFSDFQCPFCRQFWPTLKQVEEKYKDKVRIIYRQYPIPSLHPFATKAAEASLCANDQGKFWEMHDLMFQEQNQLAIKDLKLKAGRLGINQKEFDGCLDAGKYAEKVQEDTREGSRFGVTGTPALFINGVIVDGGSVPFETLAALLDAEIARTSAK
jgi:protein-disulfide isomerase